jgi:hypothetical protein
VPINTISVLADSDTRWKWGALTARRIAPDAYLDAYLLRGRATPTDRQLGELGINADAMREVTSAEFLARAGEQTAKDGADVLVLACVGGTVQAMLHGLSHAWRDAERRPVIVTGYVGVVYEKLTDGLLLRHGADVVLANSPHDAARFRAVYEGVGADPSCVVGTALPFLGGDPYEPRPGRPFTVVFAVQPSVPDSRREREYLLRRIAGHAERHPERRVLVKLRSKPGEQTTHVEENPYPKLAAKLSLPASVEFAYGHMSDVLDGTDLLVTVSSTAALEAMHRRIPTAVLTDFGIREALGNHHFVGSGALASWDEIDDGLLPRAADDWLREHGVTGTGGPGAEASFTAVRERVAALAERAGVGKLPLTAPYYSARTAPGYLPGVLARHGLGPDGLPFASGAAAGTPNAARRVLRDLSRNAARAAYRHGVQRVAPVIRRWGQV